MALHIISLLNRSNPENLLYFLSPHLTPLHQDPPTLSLLKSATLQTSRLHSFLKRRAQSSTYIINSLSLSLSLSLSHYSHKYAHLLFKKLLLPTYLSSYYCFSVPLFKNTLQEDSPLYCLQFLSFILFLSAFSLFF